MLEKFITQMLGIKENYIGIDHVEIIDNAFHIELSTSIRRVTCPKCKHKHDVFIAIETNVFRVD